MTNPTETEILNRIDDPGGCRVIIEFGDSMEYCPNDEFHPWSGVCEEHTPEGYPHFPAFNAVMQTH